MIIDSVEADHGYRSIVITAFGDRDWAGVTV